MPSLTVLLVQVHPRKILVRLLLHRLCILFLLWLPVPVLAGYFNCSVIYDEFESLMNKQFLQEPDRFVSTVNQRLTRSEFEGLQKGQFTVYQHRAGMGIAVFRTNENLSGKLLFHWSEPLVDGQSHLIIENGVIFSSVRDGYGARRIGPFRVKPGYGLDLDTGQYDTHIGQTQSQTETIMVDLTHSIDPDSGEPAIEAANDALLHFPVETMCNQTSQ